VATVKLFHLWARGNAGDDLVSERLYIEYLKDRLRYSGQTGPLPLYYLFDSAHYRGASADDHPDYHFWFVIATASPKI
jgi:hypothetical protein